MLTLNPKTRKSAAQMESSARRRLESISRHLLLSEFAAQHLRLNLLAAAEPIPSPVIVGGMVLDIHAKPHGAHTLPGTTTPGKVQYVSGGVARNIAECMSKLRTKPFMISVLGHDMAGDVLLKYWESAGLRTEGIRKIKGITTPVVMNIFDCRGELAAGVASVEAVETYLTPDWIEQFRRNIHSGPMLVVDANLHPQSIEVVCQIAAECGIPIWFEPVSVAKSTRIASVVNCITCTSPNENELIAMANALSSGGELYSIRRSPTEGKVQSIENLLQTLKPAISVLLDKGIKVLIVTLGSDGVFICFNEELHLVNDLFKNNSFSNQLYELVNEHCHSKQLTNRMEFRPSYSRYVFHFPALPASVVSLTGAGDCLVAGILASSCSGLDIMQSTAVGIAVAKAAVETENNVPEEFSLKKLSGWDFTWDAPGEDHEESAFHINEEL